MYRSSQFLSRLENKGRQHHGFDLEGIKQAQSLEHNATLNSMQVARIPVVLPTVKSFSPPSIRLWVRGNWS